MKKNWSLIVVAIVILALPFWGKLSVIFARDQFLRLEDIRVTSIDPKGITPSAEEIDEIPFVIEPSWTLMETLQQEGKLFMLFGDHVFQDFFAYKYTVVQAQIIGEEVFSVSDERPFQMILYGMDDEFFLYGKHYGNREYELHLFHSPSGEDFIVKEFGHLYEQPQVSYIDGMISYLIGQQWEVLDVRGRPVEVDIKWDEKTTVKYVIATADSIFFYVEEDPLRFLLTYDRGNKSTRHVQVGERITKITPMNNALLIERGGTQTNYAVGYQGQRKLERIREGKKFDHFCVMSEDLICWVQNNMYEVYDIQNKEIIYAKELTTEQLEKLREEGLIFYIPPLESLRWVRLE